MKVSKRFKILISVTIIFLASTQAWTQTKSLKVGDAAGGALSGTYPNPGIANNAVGAAQIAPNACGGSELSDTGVIPGTYSAATVTVDIDGRITSASDGVISTPPFDFEHLQDTLHLDADTTIETQSHTLQIDAAGANALALDGKIVTKGGTPTLSAPSCSGEVIGTDTAGTIILYGSSAECILIFSTPYAELGAPVCVLSYLGEDGTNTPTLRLSGVNSEGFSFTTAENLIVGSNAINYICLGR